MQFYLSMPANPQLASLAQSLARKGREVRLLPLTDLPPTQPIRLGPLRIEQSELLASLAFINWSLQLLKNGTWQPDAVLESALRLDRAAMEARLLVVTPLLLAGPEGGPEG
jgi:hypothetical protein